MNYKNLNIQRIEKEFNKQITEGYHRTASLSISAQNKIILAIPCHRVVRSDGNIGGFSSIGGIKLKRKLLNFEKNF